MASRQGSFHPLLTCILLHGPATHGCLPFCFKSCPEFFSIIPFLTPPTFGYTCQHSLIFCLSWTPFFVQAGVAWWCGAKFPSSHRGAVSPLPATSRLSPWLRQIIQHYYEANLLLLICKVTLNGLAPCLPSPARFMGDILYSQTPQVLDPIPPLLQFDHCSTK